MQNVYKILNRQNPHSSKILKTHLDESFRADKRTGLWARECTAALIKYDLLSASNILHVCNWMPTLMDLWMCNF